MKFCLSICISITLFSQTALAVACRDFNTQAEAQKWHEQYIHISPLDRDKDGEACECLPGGSAYGNPKCKL